MDCRAEKQRGSRMIRAVRQQKVDCRGLLTDMMEIEHFERLASGRALLIDLSTYYAFIYIQLLEWKTYTWAQRSFPG